MNLTYQSAFEKYIDYSKNYKGKSDRTIANYYSVLKNFHDFIRYHKKQTIIMVNNIELDDIHQFIKANKNRKLKNSTRFNTTLQQNTLYIYVCCLRSFFRYLGMIKVDCIHWETIETIKKEESKIEKITDEELWQLIELTKSEVNPLVGKRNLIMISLAYYSGLRLAELLSLRFFEIPRGGGSINVIGKGSKQRTIRIKKEVADLIYSYKDDRKKLSNRLLNTGEDYIFTTLAPQLDPNTQLGEGGVKEVFQKYRKMMGTKKQITCHSLRHKFSMDLYEKGTSLEVIQKLLGHADIKTTQIYATIQRDVLKNACLSL